MQGSRMLTKKDLHELIDNEFIDVRDNEVIASLFRCKSIDESVEQQCIMFHREIKE